MTRRRLASSAIAFVVILTTAAVAAPARADTGSITCSGWSHDTYSPGLTNTTQSTTTVVDDDFNVIDEYSPTGSCAAVGSSATSGEADVTLVADRSCTQLLNKHQTVTINWNDGQSSTYSGTATVVRGESQTITTITAAVDSGEFAGDEVTQINTAPNTAFANCGTQEGVTNLNFADVLTITSSV